MKKGIMTCEYEGTLKHGKVFGYFLGNLPTVFLTDTDIIREIFVKQFQTFPNRSQAAYISSFWEKSVLMTTDVNHWKFLRSTMTPSFTSGKLKKMNGLVLECIDNLIDVLKEKSDGSDPVDMVPIFKATAMDIICKSAMGVEANALKNPDSEFLRQVSKLLHFSLEKNPILLLLFFIPDIKHVCRIFDIDYNNSNSIQYIMKSIQSVINERINNNNTEHNQDLLQLMINSNKETSGAPMHNGQIYSRQTSRQSRKISDSETEAAEKVLIQPDRHMTIDEVTVNSLIFLFAGYDTTSTATIFTTYFLATEPELQEKLIQEIDENIGQAEPTYEAVNNLHFLDNFLSEVLRLYPPVTRVNRQMTTEINMKGYKIPAGISVTVPVYTIHRLPDYWPDPLKFDPDRFLPENKHKIIPYTYLPFGAGPRNCMGTRFALMELKLTTVRLLQNFKFKPSSELNIPPILEKNVFCRPVGGMKLILEKRQ